MTRKLYYEDCHLNRFSARVTGCRRTDRGYEITLDATAFYPEGGGQACDIGTLGNARVTDVRERDEEVIHLCDAPLEVGTQVEGTIDYARRFDLMQQHTGEHILSGIVHRRYGYHNTGFHVGADMLTIDFNGVIPQEDLAEIEREANEALWQNIPLRCWIPEPEELSQMSYRSKRELPWPVRIVQIPGWDSCACCGVHVAATGEVGLLKIFSSIGFRGGTRMEMACGRRAMDILNQIFIQNRQVSQAFSAKITETGTAARRMNDLLAEEKLHVAALQKMLFVKTAEGYKDQKNVLHFAEGLEPAMVRELADTIASVCAGWAAVFSGTDEIGYSYCLVSHSEDVTQLGREMTQALSGRGGGKPGIQQGRVSSNKNRIAEFFRGK